MRPRVLLAVLLVGGCAPTVTEKAPPLAAPGIETYRATVEVDAEPGYKSFQGVWLVSKDGTRRVVAYRADPLWRAFEGRPVEVRGEVYTPPGQAIMAEHFRVDHLRIVEPNATDRFVSVAADIEIAGEFATYEWPEGTKLEGETAPVFDAEGGTRYWLANPPASPPSGAVTIKAREVELSPFSAHAGGPHLWVTQTIPAVSSADRNEPAR